MTIRTQMSDTDVDWSEVANLFASVGWGDRDPINVRRAFQKSTYVCFAFHDSKLVGFGRTIDDGRYYATVVDVVVHPEYQRQNIGQQIMRNLQNALKGFVLTTLTAVPAAQSFYEKLGWRKLKTGMMLPRSEEQANSYCE